MIFLAIVAIAVIIALTTGRNGKDNTLPSSDHEANEKAIPYEVLKKEKRRLDGKLIMDVLVNEATPREEVLKLAESLRRDHAGKYAYICIFDSREAQRRRLDESYPERELSRHWLVVVDWGGDTGSKEEIRWVAEGRDH